MLSKGNIKFIHSLRLKKQRDIHQKFIVEGDKLVKEFLQSGWTVSYLFACPGWLADLPAGFVDKPELLHEVSAPELRKISTLTTPNQALAVIEKPDFRINPDDINNGFTLLLDDIQDPGNLGTILRIAAWFGISNVVCSPSTVDVFNPKVVQATMGALLYIEVHYMNTTEFLSEFSQSGLSVYGTFPQGKSIYETKLERKGIIILGNESQGISNELRQYVTQQISIPGYGPFSSRIESLNVAVAASIICAEFRRQEMN